MLDALSGTTDALSDNAPSSDRAEAWQDATRHALAQVQQEGTASAAGTIAQVTDPQTGQVDTKALAGAVAGAAGSNMDRASQAYADIRGQLETKDPQLASQFDSDVRNAVRAGDDVLKGTSQGLTAAGRDLLVNNPILTKRWESTTSAWTGKGGFTQGLSDMLEGHGIQVAPGTNPIPPGSVGRTGGVTQNVANNTNGATARDAIADRLRGQGYDVQTEVPRNGGRRVVDVVADHKAADPRYNERLEVESKVGRTGQSPIRAGQAAQDAEALAENVHLRGAGSALESAGKIVRPIAIVADAVQLGQAYHQDGDKIGTHTGEAAAGVAGGWGGAIAGAEGGAAVGAVIGTAVPVVGNIVGGVVGGIVGGIAGGIGGDWAGRKAFDTIKSWF